MRKRLRWFMMPVLLVWIIGTMALGAFGSEYDAVYTVTSGRETINQKMYFKNADKLRLEMSTKQGAVKVITRLDKNVSWMLIDEQKMYMEQQIDPQAVKQYRCDPEKAKKTGTEKVLNYNCDIFEYVDGKQTCKYWMVPNVMAIARTLILENGTEKFRMEATEINLRKQADSLFEIPSGYQKLSLNLKIPKQ